MFYIVHATFVRIQLHDDNEMMMVIARYWSKIADFFPTAPVFCVPLGVTLFVFQQEIWRQIESTGCRRRFFSW